MSKQTVTSELRKSIIKVTGKIIQCIVYSDSRKGNAVGVKFAFTQYSQPIIEQIVEDMQNKGFKLKYVRYNRSYGYGTVPGQRFCFYNK